MADIHLKYLNDVHVQVVADPGIVMELADTLTYYAENYKFNPKYRAKIWDGRISLVNRMNGVVYAGLAQRIKKFCDSRDYSFSFDPELTYESISEHELREFIKSLKIPAKYEIRDYQFDSILKCIRAGRRTLVSPTSSGKSLMIYVLMRYYQEHKGLVIVPTIGLVSQMESDFRDYGYEGEVHSSINGLSKANDIPCDIVITTWQSLNNGKTKMPPAWYKQFGVVFGDEAHGAKATSLIQILSSLQNCRNRFGTTGTLDGNPLNEATIEGLFGAKYQAVTTKQLMDQGFVTKLKIKCIVLKYPKETCKTLKKASYQEEVDFIAKHEGRNNFIKNLTLSLKGNKLVFFRLTDHGEELYKAISSGNDNAFYIDGSVKGEVREQIRKAIEDEENATLVASLGTTSTGVSINKLHHMIAASPSKSKIKVLQSIGRMLRQHKSKEYAILYDIIDDLSDGAHKNFTLRHFIERTKIYDAEEFEWKIYHVNLK